jgi:flagellar hook-associated protein 3 FlgL
MSTRITNAMVARSVLSDLNRADETLGQTQRRLSSGNQITRPSDDPYGTSRAMDLRGDLEGVRQYQRNVDDALAFNGVTDVALSKVSDAINRVHELTVQGASDSAGPVAKQAIAAELDQIIESIKQEANASYAGQYVLAGTATSTRPYGNGVAGDVYAGDTAAINREIGPGVTLKVNAVASDVLGNGSDGKLLAVLRGISAHLKSGTAADANSLRTTDLASLDASGDTLSAVRAAVGATANRLQTAQARLQEVEETNTKLLSDIEDADMAKTMVDYSMQQSAYQAALRSGANIVQASLLDFLR